MSRKTISNIKRFARICIKKGIKLNAAMVSNIIPSHRIDLQDRIFILMYHRVNSYRKNELSVNTTQFKRQLDWLKSQGFRNMRMTDLESGFVEKIDNSRRLIFTFDDGYEDNYINAFPLLKEYGYTGIFYLATNYIGTNKIYPLDIAESNRIEQNQIMNWRQVLDMLQEGMEIGSHTMNHSALTSISMEDARREIFESKKKLEQKLQIEISSFCYPGGYFEKQHTLLVKNAGYRSACTASPGIWRGHDLYELPRVPVLSSDIFFVFKQKLAGRMEWFRMIH